MSRWFRLDDDVINDPKILLLPEAMRWIWIAFLCVASKNNGTLPAVEIIALSLRVKVAKATEYRDRLVAAGLIDQTETGFAPHNWDKRQFKSDEGKKDSYVYVIGQNWTGDLKIGFSKNPWARLTELQTGHPEKIDVLAIFKCRASSEIALHDLLKEFRGNGEWFNPPSNIRDELRYAQQSKRNYDDTVVKLRELLRSTTTHTQTQSEPQKKDAAVAAPDAETDLFRRGREVLGKAAGGLIKQLLTAKDGKVNQARAAIETAAGKNDPREYIGAIIRNRDPPPDSASTRVDPRL